MNEEFARGLSTGVDLCFERIGDPAGEPLVLVMGLGAPMNWWDTGLCELLAERGFHVIRFDNRDCGHSSTLDGRADFWRAGLLRQAPYKLDDMAADVVALLDHLGLTSAHVVGASMGGMISQLLAIQHPHRVRSLTSIMSTTGNRRVGLPSRTGIQALLTAPPTDRAGYVEHSVAQFTRLASPGFPADPQRLRTRAEVTFDRGLNASGRARQLGAVLAATDRSSRLRELRMPVTVIHGTDDHLVNVSGGLATARAVPGAELHVISGMAHELPVALWPRFADFIEHTAGRTPVLQG